MQLLERLDRWAVSYRKQPLGDHDLVIRRDPEEMGIEGGVMQQAIGNDGLTEPLIGVGGDVGGIKELLLRKPGYGTSSTVSGDDGGAERCLMKPHLDLPKCVPPFHRGFCRIGVELADYEHRDAAMYLRGRLQALCYRIQQLEPLLGFQTKVSQQRKPPPSVSFTRELIAQAAAAIRVQ